MEERMDKIKGNLGMKWERFYRKGEGNFENVRNIEKRKIGPRA